MFVNETGFVVLQEGRNDWKLVASCETLKEAKDCAESYAEHRGEGNLFPSYRIENLAGDLIGSR